MTVVDVAAWILAAALAAVCPAPHADALQAIDVAEAWQVALFAAQLPIGHAAHWDAAERTQAWQWQAWATCPGGKAGERAAWLGWVWAWRLELATRHTRHW